MPGMGAHIAARYGLKRIFDFSAGKTRDRTIFVKIPFH
jgi:hypothetical protein